MHYEGGPQWATGINLPNGVNSVNQTDIGALAAQIIALQWDVSSYTPDRKANGCIGYLQQQYRGCSADAQ